MTRNVAYDLYYNALDADDALRAALIEHYGEKGAGDARYLPLREHPLKIRALAAEHQRAFAAWHAYAAAASKGKES